MFNRIIALSVGLFFLVTQYPVTFGQDLTTTSFTIGPTEEFDPGELSGIEILDKREESVKHFCMEDGYMCAVVYPDAVHYKDGNEFKEIDNTLVENDKNEFVNTDSPMKVKFPKTLNNENPVSINVEGKQITWYYISGKETKSEGVVHNSKERTNDQTEVNQIISRAEYKNVDDNIDLDYMINSFEVKEKIVINKKTEKEIFKFNFQTNGLKARINTENEIEFIDEGSEPSNPRIIYKIGRGLMYDNSGNFSDAIKYEVSKAESGYIISIIPDKEWMESQERSYPIVIDPPINSQPSHKDIEDAYTNSYYSKNPKKNRRNKSFWGSWFLPVGRAKHDQIFETYLKFKGLPQLSKGEMIVKSYLCLCVPKDRNDACYRSILNKINVKKVIDPWNQKTISWDNAPKVDKSVTDYTNIDETGKWYKWDITRMTRDWYKLPNVNENNGVQLSSQILCEDKYVRFVGTDISTKPEFNAIRPKVMIHYRNFNGIKPHWSYSKHSVGTCGTGAVNNYSGNLTITEDVFSNSGLRIPLNISNTYNSVNSNEQANSYIITCEHIRSKDHKINPDGHSRSSKSGFGWYLSFNAMLQPISSSDFLYKQGYRYVYIDSDATVHYFKLDGGEIVDEDGLGLKLSTIDKGPKSSGLGESVKITDKSDNVIIFKDNVLNQIIDNEGNITNFICKEQPNTGGRKKDLQITDIIEPNGRKTTINYNSDGFVSSILHPDGKSTTFEYSKGLLKKINYPDGLKTGYTYDSKNRLISGYTTKGSGNSIFYEYVSDSENSPEFNKIKKIEEYGDTYQSPTKLGNSINFEYRNDNTTKVKYENNNSEVTYGKGTEIWQFDNAGRATSILNEDGSISTVEYTKTKRGTDKSKNKILHT
ncbi:MAG: DNRLRE domain-containing protein, partial [Firmicutes bacterium]|nr:DNRLRE domain-containing protein [Bacillota bacterium]